ncbi:MAG: hypothetical protein JJE04_03455 [Acidobacteriia bacterium]|nr:hypothetical protein [Terriglobia bacterium]
MKRVNICGLVAAVTIASLGYGQSGSRILREGEYWTETITGSLQAADATKLRVAIRGGVVVRGASIGQVQVVYRKRVRARDSGQARKLLDSQQLRLSRQGEWANISLVEAGWSLVSGQMEIIVPASLRQSIIETRSGNLNVSGLRGDVEGETGGGEIEADRIQGNLVARTGGGSVQVGTIGGSARLVTGGGPIRLTRSGGETWIETGGGEIVVGDAGGPLHLSTGAGNIQVTRAAASVSARTMGGVIKVLEAGGTVDIENAGGGIQVGQASSIRCESMAGGIRLLGVSGELSATTAVGDILAELLRGHNLRNSYLSTSSGDVTVTIPSNLAVTVRALNESAGRMRRIVSDFPEIRVDASGASGQLNGGGPLLKIAAQNGTIYLRRQR